MLSIPIPFLTAGFFWLILVLLCRWRLAWTVRLAVIVFASLCAILSLLVALRWSTSWLFPRFLMPILAASLGPSAWFCFARFHWSRSALHILPIVVIAVVSLQFPRWGIEPDWLVVLSFVTYGVLLIYQGLSAEGFTWSRLSQSRQVADAASGVGLWLWGMALIDGVIAWDFAHHHGHHAAMIISISHVLLLIGLIYWLVIFIPTQHQLERTALSGQSVKPPSVTAGDNDDYRQIMVVLRQWLIDEKAYQSDDLSLDRMARKLGRPARQISAAVNQSTGQNVSQWVNDIRIEEAKQQLIVRNDTVTAIMQDCGYLTKSNFNREFRRVTGMSPTQWRTQHALRSDINY